MSKDDNPSKGKAARGFDKVAEEDLVFSDPFAGRDRFTIFIAADFYRDDGIQPLREMFSNTDLIAYAYDIESGSPSFFALSPQSLASAHEQVRSGDITPLRLLQLERVEVRLLKDIPESVLSLSLLTDMRINPSMAQKKGTLFHVREARQPDRALLIPPARGYYCH